MLSKVFVIIEEIVVWEILDFRGCFIIEVEVWLESGVYGIVQVFSGVFIGSFEVYELWDGDFKCYDGKGVEKVVWNVIEKIVLVVEGLDVFD